MNIIPDWINPNDHWLIYLIAFNVVLFTVTLGFILFIRVYYILNHRRERKFESTLLSLLSAALNYPEKEEMYVKKIHKLVRKRWQYEILLDNLVVMCYSFSGSYAERSKNLYTRFNLKPMSNRKLQSNRWWKVVEGIIEISIVGNKNAYKEIIPLLDHENFHVRRQAKIAIVEIGQIKGLMEMESKIGIMSRWTFISILSIIHRSAFKLKPEELERLKKSQNPATRRLSAHLEKYSVA